MKRLSNQEFIEKAIEVHGELYDYSRIQYTTAHNKIDIICKTHGVFQQKPNNHLTGYGCRQCGFEKCAVSNRKPQDQFIKDSKVIHGDQYLYENTKYINDSTKVIITCPIHGDFKINPSNHLYSKQGCRSCNIRKSRKQENWLDILKVPKKFREKKVIMHDGSYIIADAFNPSKNTIYEFWGDYWHGNLNIFSNDYINPHVKKTMGELHQEYLNRKEKIKISRYNLIEIWESDFDNQKSLGRKT